MNLPGYDAWKLASPPEYERDSERCECGDYPLEEVPSDHCCMDALEADAYDTLEEAEMDQ